MSVAWFDFETCSPVDLKRAGGDNYARHPDTDVLALAWAFDDEHTQVWSPAWCHPDPEREPAERVQLDRLLRHVADGGVCVAWNSHFDWNIWHFVARRLYDWPELRVTQTLDAMAQAEGSLLPASLGKAAEAIRAKHKKHADGRGLIAQLSIGQSRKTWPPCDNWRDLMRRFRRYAGGDIPPMREVFYRCRPLSIEEWQVFWANEAINIRGKYVDIEFAAAAAKLAAIEKAQINGRLQELSSDTKMSVDAHKRKATWTHEALSPAPDLQDLVYKGTDDKGRPKFSLDEPTRAALLDALGQDDYADLFAIDDYERAVAFIEAVDAGNSAAAKKFPRIVELANPDDHRLRGGYAMNGAGQTGRFSARGLQDHNLIRASITRPNPDGGPPLEDSNFAMDFFEEVIRIANHTDPSEHAAEVAKLEKDFGLAFTRLLGRALRPTIQAPPGRLLAWCDWSSIEARMLPWLANSRGGERKLDVFRRYDAGEGPDQYKVAAGAINGVPPEAVTKAQRQEGKVLELSLGYGGGFRALRAMAKGYGLVLDVERAKELVQAWRTANGWAVTFWYQLWDAAMLAIKYPGTLRTVGRVAYFYLRDLLGGTLVCQLPCGRPIIYPTIRQGAEVDEETGKTRFVTTYRRAYGQSMIRAHMWHGLLAENITQAASASLLHRAVVELQDVAVAHTHDEVVAEDDADRILDTCKRLENVMLTCPAWAEGLPLAVASEHGPFYTK